MKPLVSMILALLMGSLAPSALAGEATEAGAPAAAGGWVSIRAGVSVEDLITLDTAAAIQSQPGLSPLFGIAASYRFARLDLGLLFEQLGSFRFDPDRDPGTSRHERSGAQLRAALDLRWRFVDDGWGALFCGVSPGLMVFEHGAGLRAEAARLSDASLDEVDAYGLGFSLGIALGLRVNLSERVSLSAQMELVTGETSLDTAAEAVTYVLARSLLSVGVEWRM